MTGPVLVVGAGISGLACARVLTDAGLDVRVLDRGHLPGGRLMGRRVESLVDGETRERVVDIGASYFTAQDPDFAELVAGWKHRGLAREWTDSIAVIGGRAVDGARLGDERRQGPVRWAATRGLRSLAADLVAPPDREPLTLEREHDVPGVAVGPDGPSVEGVEAAAVVLAMPDPQAADLLPRMVATRLDVSARWNWRPCVSVYAGWSEAWWPEFGAAFVNDNPQLVFVADDGDRRGDGAPVLTAHVAPDESAAHLDDPRAVVPATLAELGPLLAGIVTPRPDWARAHRWSLAEPLRQHADALFGWDEESRIGVCGDAWGERSKVETAWVSGHRLGRHLLGQLAVG
ncbi:NAD(P)/FAD-dependent oxidoreductase [Kineococcus gynurae]|uniref:NAD(P)/FAD-dependent oxidoreductase n=1 Tax=Kineococcus gynurae TaxID=452979 RepID=A0ABV5LS26_9ACTN